MKGAGEERSPSSDTALGEQSGSLLILLSPGCLSGNHTGLPKTHLFLVIRLRMELLLLKKTICRLPQTLSSLKELSSAYPREGFPRQESGDRSAMRRLVLGSIAVAK